MIKELRTTEIDQDCAGTQMDGTPCPNVNTIPIANLFLGGSMTPPLYVDCGSNNWLVIWAKMTSKSITIVDPGMTTASTTAAEMGGVITVTLAYSGGITGTVGDVVTAINGTTTVKDSIYSLYLGSSSGTAIAVGNTSLLYSGTSFQKDAIKFPICPNCGSYETVLRTWNTLPASQLYTTTNKHRQVVNYLGKQLKTAGRINPFCKTSVMAEMSDPPNMPSNPPFPSTSPPFTVF